jgi:15-cis-phytoene synthase
MTGVASADLAACRALLRQGSRSFYAASLLLPRHVREPATALYAFCRVADDAVDQTGEPAVALARLHERLDCIYARCPRPDAVDRALASVVDDFAMPRTLLDALLDGFAWDAENRRYADIGELRAYGARVAGTVGAMMTVLMGGRHAATLARACDLGIAMQLTNIARDVGEDARNGRLYLPQDWMREAGLDPDVFLRDPVFDERIATVVQRLLNHAATLYERSRDGVAALPSDCRPAIHAARLVYSEIGAIIARNGHDSVSRRAYVGARRKLGLLAEAVVAARGGSSGRPHPVLDEARYLVEAVVRKGVPLDAVHASRTFAGSRTSRVLDIFEKLERAGADRKRNSTRRLARETI